MYKCNKCDGSRKLAAFSHSLNDGTVKQIQCSKCLGSGELDWIEYIIGKRKPKYLSCDCNIIFVIDRQIMEELYKKVKYKYFGEGV